ncbi:hypothetical protein HZC21_00325 [Candidatus Peregrinibacteria bacterium]|nr:hypothetical protein [Candidatus Peregrinibacteria bacterium]
MPKEQPEILGKNWTKEVGTWKAEKEVRNEFYQKAAGLRFEVDADLNAIVKNPEKKGLKTQEELKGADDFTYRVKRNGDRLYNILGAYFKRRGAPDADAKTREKEVALSLYCLTQQGLNVDLIVPSWKVEIRNGQLFITKSTGEPFVDGAYLRTIPGVTDKVEEGWTTLPPIPGLPAKKLKKKPRKPKESDILETF